MIARHRLKRKSRRETVKDYNDFKEHDPFYNRIKSWREEGELRAEYFDEYKKLGLTEIIQAFDELKAQRYEKDTDENQECERRLDAIRLLISMRLELFSDDQARHLHYIIEDTAWFHICKLREQVQELIHQFKNHRHDKDKNYTEKPVW